jgi:hypothetical protein
MMLRQSLLAAALALPLAVVAQSEDQLIERYTELAGSEENAAYLVKGLREGKEVTLTNGGTTETFTPPTGNMGWGEITQTYGFKLGEVKRADKASVQKIEKTRGIEKAERVAKVERPVRPEKPERPVKPERPERPERPHGKGR